MSEAQLAQMTDADRITEGIRRGVGKLGPEVQRQLRGLLTPESLAVASVFFVAWLVSHTVGVGFVIDALLLGVGIAAVGLAVFAGVDELMAFGRTALQARTDAQMDKAAEHFASAVAILGVQALLALLLRRAPQTFRGARVRVGPAPPSAGFKLKPGLRAVRSGDPGQGVTTWWGEITISRLGTVTDRRLAALHEAVHRALTPKLDVLRNVRIQGRAASYTRSSLITYLEEALAESFAQVSVNGLRGLITGIVFPVRYGYVTVLTRQVTQAGVLMPVVPELAGLLVGSVNANASIWDVYFSSQRPK